MRIIIFLSLVMSGAVHGATIEGKSFPDSMTANKKKLVLNGVGLRTKKKLGISFKVYVGGLYVTAKSADAAKHIEPGDKVLDLVFLRSLDKDTLQEAWTEAFAKNCVTECDTSADKLKQFNDLMADVNQDSHLTMNFDPDGVSVELKGKKDVKSGRIAGAGFAKNLMAVFIGAQPPTEELKKGLLGQ